MSNTPGKIKLLPYRCLVCDAPAEHAYFGAIACHACKMFFRRNALAKQHELQCKLSNQCSISIHTRNICSACRLAKCFRSGMSIELFRPSRIDKMECNSLIPVRQQISGRLPTLNILQADQSLLTTSQWTLLSNLIHCYVEADIVACVKSLMNSYWTTDFTAVGYNTRMNDLLISVYEAVGKYIASNNDLRRLPFDDRSMMLRGIADNICCTSGIFIVQHCRLYDLNGFLNIMISKYGKSTVDFQLWAKNFVDPDIALAKLAISLFAFSQNSHCYYSSELQSLSNSRYLFSIEIKYAEVTWKYLLYKYGYRDSVKRFLNLVVWLISMSKLVVHIQALPTHVNDVDSIIEQTELDLILNDNELIDSTN